MRLLALDTATSAITVAVHDGDRVLAERSALDPRRHTELLAPLVEQTLADARLAPGDLTDVAVGTGPGPFTGLRVGLATARTMAHALDLPVHGVCSLDALAHAAAMDGHDGELLVATDARRREVYAARYVVQGGAITRVSGPEVLRAADLPEQVRALPVVGRGAELYPEALPHGRGPLDVAAGALADLAVRRIAAGAEMPVEPLYLRRPDAVAPAAPKSAIAAGGPPRSGGSSRPGRRSRSQQTQPGAVRPEGGAPGETAQ